MRKMTMGVALASVLALSISGLAAAQIADSTLDVSLKAKPAKSGTKKNPRPVAFTLGIEGGTKSGVGQPSTTTRLDIVLPKGLRWNGRSWARKDRCSTSRVQQARSTDPCPRRAIIGRGHVTALGGNGGIVEEIDVTPFVNETGQLGLFLKADRPVAIAAAIVGRVNGRNISVAIPGNIQEPIVGVPTAIKTLTFSLTGKTRVKGKSRGVIESTSCSKRWTLKLTNVVRDGRLNDTASVPCRK